MSFNGVGSVSTLGCPIQRIAGLLLTTSDGITYWYRIILNWALSYMRHPKSVRNINWFNNSLVKVLIEINETTDTFTSRTHSAYYQFVIMKLHDLGSQIIGKLDLSRIRLVSISLSLFSLLKAKIISEIGVKKLLWFICNK
jgi:hypothetical protein